VIRFAVTVLSHYIISLHDQNILKIFQLVKHFCLLNCVTPMSIFQQVLRGRSFDTTLTSVITTTNMYRFPGVVHSAIPVHSRTTTLQKGIQSGATGPESSMGCWGSLVFRQCRHTPRCKQRDMIHTAALLFCRLDSPWFHRNPGSSSISLQQAAGYTDKIKFS
jgi:hypothetical protein